MAKVSYAFTIGNLMYAMVYTRLNIAHATGIVSKYMSNPRKQHWEVMIRWFDKFPNSLLENEMKDLMSKMQATIILSYGK